MILEECRRSQPQIERIAIRQGSGRNSMSQLDAVRLSEALSRFSNLRALTLIVRSSHILDVLSGLTAPLESLYGLTIRSSSH